VACAVSVAWRFTQSATALPPSGVLSPSRATDPAGDADGAGTDLTEIAAFNGPTGALGFRIDYANRACGGAGDSLAVFLDVDRNPSTGSSTGGFEYALFLDGSTRTASVGQWNGSSFATTSIPAAGGCSSAKPPSADSVAVSAPRLGIGSSFDFVVETGWSVDDGAQLYHDHAGPFTYTLSAPTPAPSPPPPRPRPPRPPAKTYESAPLLASQVRYAGKSIKHTRLTETVYATMKSLGIPRLLPVACWSKEDWPSVLESAGGGSDPGVVTLASGWRSPRGCIHRPPAPTQALIDSRIPEQPASAGSGDGASTRRRTPTASGTRPARTATACNSSTPRPGWPSARRAPRA
jgi:hypothetical protein